MKAPCSSVCASAKSYSAAKTWHKLSLWHHLQAEAIKAQKAAKKEAKKEAKASKKEAKAAKKSKKRLADHMESSEVLPPPPTAKRHRDSRYAGQSAG